jgi:hypothetical protein
MEDRAAEIAKSAKEPKNFCLGLPWVASDCLDDLAGEWTQVFGAAAGNVALVRIGSEWSGSGLDFNAETQSSGVANTDGYG